MDLSSVARYSELASIYILVSLVPDYMLDFDTNRTKIYIVPEPGSSTELEYGL